MGVTLETRGHAGGTTGQTLGTRHISVLLLRFLARGGNSGSTSQHGNPGTQTRQDITTVHDVPPYPTEIPGERHSRGRWLIRTSPLNRSGWMAGNLPRTVASTMLNHMDRRWLKSISNTDLLNTHIINNHSFRGFKPKVQPSVFWESVAIALTRPPMKEHGATRVVPARLQPPRVFQRSCRPHLAVRVVVTAPNSGFTTPLPSGCRRVARSTMNRSRSGSIHMEVPVNPPWPMAASDK